jgi:hypothetical protein
MTDATKTDYRRLIYKLMSDALIELRAVAYEGRGHKGIYKIADLFHNVPLSLERLDREGGSFSDLLTKIKTHADRNGSRPWLDGAIERIERSMHASEGRDN